MTASQRRRGVARQRDLRDELTARLFRVIGGMNGAGRAKILGFLHLADAPHTISVDLVVEAAGSVTLTMRAVDPT